MTEIPAETVELRISELELQMMLEIVDAGSA